MSSESRIWEIRLFGSMRGGSEVVIGLRAFQSILSRLLYNPLSRAIHRIGTMLYCLAPSTAGISGILPKSSTRLKVGRGVLTAPWKMGQTSSFRTFSGARGAVGTPCPADDPFMALRTLSLVEE